MADIDGEQVGVCLDIDGTLYRQGSVFIETVASLAVESSLFDTTARAQLRDVVGTVAEFYGSGFTRWRWEQTLRGLETLRHHSGAETAARVLDWLRRLREQLDDVLPATDTQIDPAARAVFQERLLEQYSRAIRGVDRAALSDAIQSILCHLQPINPQTATVVSQLAATGADIVLITDMPTHVADVFADVVLDAPVKSVVGTAFSTDEAEIFTGEYTPIQKDAVVDIHVKNSEWTSTVAAGDTDRDAAMAPYVDVFVAVAGHGGVQRAVQTLSGEQTVRYVAPGEPLGKALREVCPAG